MPTFKVTEGGRQYAMGRITAAPANFIPPGACTVGENVDPTRAGSCVAKRKGFQIDQAELAASETTVTGLYQYIITSSGVKKNIASKGSNVYDVSGGVWTSKYAGAMAGAACEFATFKDLLIFVSQTESAYKWDGVTASFGLLGGTPPANGKYVCVWKGRVFIANTSAGKSRLHWSAVQTAEDWVTANDAGYADVNPDDGDEITGLKSLGLVLAVFKRSGVYLFYGSSPTDFQLRQVDANHGCVSHRSIVNMGPFLIYLSEYGIHSLNGSNVQGVLSGNLRYEIETMAFTTKQRTAAGRLQNLYILAYDSDGDGKNDSAHVLDVYDGTWYTWTNMKAAVFYKKDDGTCLYGGSDRIVIRKANSGEDDEGSAIAWRYRTRAYDGGDYTGMKYVEEVWFQAKPLAGKTLAVRAIVDGVQVDENSMSLTAHQTLATAESFYVNLFKALDTYQGRFIQLEFYNAELNAPVELYQHTLVGTVHEEQPVDGN